MFYILASFLFINQFEEREIQIGEIFVIPDDRDLVKVIEKSKTQNLKLGLVNIVTNFYIFKIFNRFQYGSKYAGGTSHVPKGYDWWIGLKGNSKYYNYTLSVNGTAVTFRNVYLTDLLVSKAF